MRIYLRDLALADASVSFKWRNDLDVWKYTGSKPDKVITEEIEKNWLKNVLGRNNEKRFAICVEGTDEYIGNVQLTNITEVDAEFHLFIGAKEYWNKGLGTLATKELLRIAFEKFKLNSVYLTVNSENSGAIKAYEKSGFKTTYKMLSLTKMIAFAWVEPVLVSVFMITYNHGNFIRQALQSIIDQKCNFKFDVIIGDDASKDTAKDILIEFATKYPSLIKLILHTKNVGAQLNQEAVLNNCNGKYIAICEGDDYWTDPFKLQKQIDFLEANSDFSIAYHRVNELSSDGKITLETLNKEKEEKIYTINDLAQGNIIHTPSLVFRNISNFPSWFHESPVGDYVISMLNAEKGKIKYFPKVMAVYRRHETSTWSSLKADEAIKRWLNVLLLLIDYFKDNIEVKAILIRQFKNRFLDLKNSMISEEKYHELTLLVSKFIKIEFFEKLWIEEIYPEELQKRSESYIGIKAAIRSLKREIIFKFKSIR